VALEVPSSSPRMEPQAKKEDAGTQPCTAELIGVSPPKQTSLQSSGSIVPRHQGSDEGHLQLVRSTATSTHHLFRSMSACRSVKYFDAGALLLFSNASWLLSLVLFFYALLQCTLVN
jgi:hypothetical protein